MDACRKNGFLHANCVSRDSLIVRTLAELVGLYARLMFVLPHSLYKEGYNRSQLFREYDAHWVKL